MNKAAAVLIASLTCCGPLLAEKAKTANPPLKIHMISGAREYRSEPSLKAFAAYLQKNFHARCTLSPGRDGAKELPNLDALDKADVMLVFCRRLRLGPGSLEPIRNWCKAGKPVIGLRTASHAFQTWLAFDKEILGGDYHGHGGSEKEVKVTVEEKAADHPILAGVKDWVRPGKLYRNPNLAKDVAVLLTGTGSKDRQPLAWARVYDKKNDGRSFYTSMGLPGDFKNQTFRKLLVNAISWTAKRNLEPRKPPEKP